MSTSGKHAFMQMASNNNLTFSNETIDDIMVFTTTPQQSVLLGTNIFAAKPAGIKVSWDSNVNSNQVLMYGVVGINHSNPQNPLDVIGNGQFSGSVTASNLNFTGGFLKNNVPVVFSQWITAASSNQIYITNSNVGIGTTFPVQSLDVNGRAQVASWFMSNATLVNSTRSNNVAIDYALTQNTSGDTTINCTTNRTINFSINNGTPQAYINPTGVYQTTCYPLADGQNTVGQSNLRWNNVYTRSIVIQPTTSNGPGLTVGQASNMFPVISTFGPSASNQGLIFSVAGQSNVILTPSNVEVSSGHIRFNGTKSSGDYNDGSIKFDKVISGADSNGTYTITRGATVYQQNQLVFTASPSASNSGFLFVGSNGQTPLFVSASNNFVGIGTSNPRFTLDINGSMNINNSVGPLFRATYNVGDMITVSNSNDALDRYGLGQYTSNVTRIITSSTQSNSSIRLSKPADGTSGSNAQFADMVTLLNNGNLGVGTTNPAYKLDLAGAMNLQTGYLVNTLGDLSFQTRSNSSRLTILGGSNDNLAFLPPDNLIQPNYRYIQVQNYGQEAGNNGSGIRFGMCNNPFVSPVFAVIETYKTGTATITPNMSFRADGVERVQIRGDTGDFVPGANSVYNLGSNAQFWKAVYATNGVIQTSDSSEKIWTPLQYGLKDVEKITTIKYKWKDTVEQNPNDQHEYYGVLADELDQIFPELVYNEEKPYHLNYQELIPVLINAVKELSQEIKLLKQKSS